jgi:hypothetical protein
MSPRSAEDRAVDLYVLERAIASLHCSFGDDLVRGAGPCFVELRFSLFESVNGSVSLSLPRSSRQYFRATCRLCQNRPRSQSASNRFASAAENGSHSDDFASRRALHEVSYLLGSDRVSWQDSLKSWNARRNVAALELVKVDKRVCSRGHEKEGL